MRRHLPPGGFGTVLADPPWLERGGGRIKRGAQVHYPLMSADDIVTTMRTAPVWRPAADSQLWLWATSNHLEDALEVMDRLGFRHVTDFVWVKDRIGLGQYRRSRHEWLLLGVGGRCTKPASAWPDSVIEAPRRRHSEKPVEAYDVIEHVGRGPRLEMFARGPARPGWMAWGDEANRA